MPGLVLSPAQLFATHLESLHGSVMGAERRKESRVKIQKVWGRVWYKMRGSKQARMGGPREKNVTSAIKIKQNESLHF